MVRRKLADAERWQAVGMIRAGMTQRQVSDMFDVSHSVISRLMRRYNETGIVGEKPRSRRPKKTTQREKTC